MTTTEIRAEIVELINRGMLNVPKIVSYFKQYRPVANIKSSHLITKSTRGLRSPF
jgi:hypothetical protein